MAGPWGAGGEGGAKELETSELKRVKALWILHLALLSKKSLVCFSDIYLLLKQLFKNIKGHFVKEKHHPSPPRPLLSHNCFQFLFLPLILPHMQPYVCRVGRGVHGPRLTASFPESDKVNTFPHRTAFQMPFFKELHDRS